MLRFCRRLAIVFLSSIGAIELSAAEPAAQSRPPEIIESKAAARQRQKPKPATKQESIEALVKRALPSVVIIRGVGRDGRENGLGTGFVISADGLIATNLHVIGEGRTFEIETSDGRRLEPVAVHASDRHVDLAVVRVDAKDLQPLTLADPESITTGQDIIVLGNPQGLAHSVVKGVVSGSRIIDDMPMLQLAVPIEPGNSGGPVLDRNGRVLGVVTMKSAVTDNLGFAVNVEALQSLLEQPNTVAVQRWLTIGALDARRWETIGGAQWRQRAGHIQVSGAGAGIGSRSLCLAQDDAPDKEFELAVTVKLDDESGAAGLAFLADGHDEHYGFYPSGGRMRFVRFDGPDVYSWHVIDERPSDAYLAGDWNRLKVHVADGNARCFVNGKLVFEHAVDRPAGRRVGLVKFWQTTAEFKQFAVGKSLAEAEPSAALLAAVNALRTELPKHGATAALPATLTKEAPAGIELLRERAKALEREAERLREAATRLHRRSVVDQLAAEFAGADEKADLLRASLLIAKLDNDELDVEAYHQEVARMAAEIRNQLPAKADDSAKLAALNKYLYADNGYHGSRRDYDSRSNSYLNEVIDDREGLPITLSVLHIEIGRRLGLNMQGVGLPGHFLTAYVDKKGERQLIDAFEGGAKMTEADAMARAFEITGHQASPDILKPVGKRAIVVRMLENLLGRAADGRDDKRILGYLDAVLALNPDAMERRMMRAMVQYRGGDLTSALLDVDYLLDHHGEQLDQERVLELRDRLERERADQ